MKQEIEKLIKKVCKKWDFYKSKEVIVTDNAGSDWGSSEVKTLNGYTTSWNNKNLIWLMVNVDGSGYDESGNQVGLSRDGKIVWEYQSHCSCNSFGDTSKTHGDGELCLGCEEKPKSYQLSQLPEEWEKIVKVNLEEIVKLK